MSAKATITVDGTTVASFVVPEENMTQPSTQCAYLRERVNDGLTAELAKLPPTTTDDKKNSKKQTKGKKTEEVEYKNELPEDIGDIGEGAFSECSNIKNIKLPNEIKRIEKELFKGCSKLEKIVIPKGVTSIGASAFEGCDDIKSIVIPETVTSIESKAFKDCSELTNMNIPSGVTEIPSDLFEGCKMECVSYNGKGKMNETSIPESAIKTNETCTICDYDDCEECSIDYVCSICKEEGYKPNEERNKCHKCAIKNCETCDEDEICSTCIKEYSPSRDGKQCEYNKGERIVIMVIMIII